MEKRLFCIQRRLEEFTHNKHRLPPLEIKGKNSIPEGNLYYFQKYYLCGVNCLQ